MSAFTGRLTLIEVDPDLTQWMLGEPLSYEVGSLGSGRLIVVPAGFATDGASIPRLLTNLLPKWGRYSRAAVVHDYGYRRIGDGDPHPHMPDRRAADAVFLEAMLVLGVSRIIAYAMYGAVRAFGSAYLIRARDVAASR